MSKFCDRKRAYQLFGTAVPVLLGTVGGAESADAQTAAPAVEEVVVTASKTGETRLQEAPYAISAVSGAAIEKGVLRDVRDLVVTTPSLAISENTGFAQVFIRGVGSNNVFAGSDPSVTIHMDGVYIARPAAYVSGFLGVERIEVLRGPQGTLYGRNAVGGTINVISRKPTDEFVASMQVDIGNYDLVRGQGYISGPLIADTLSGSVAALVSEHSGYFDNIVASGNDIDSEDTKGVKAQLRYTPSADVELILRGDYLREQPNVAGYSKLLEARGSPGDIVLDDFSKVALNFPQLADRESGGVALEGNWSIAENLSVKSLTAYRESNYDAQIDSDASDVDLLHTILPERQHQFSEELNLVGNWLGAKYVLGAYYFTETIDYPLKIQNVATGAEFRTSPHVKSESYALYGQADVPLGWDITAQIGARYGEETKDFDQVGGTYSLASGDLASTLVTYSTSRKYKAFTPRLGLQWKPSSDLMVYAVAARGFKSGGFVNSSLDPAQGFGPEKLWSYEAGVKTQWLDQRLTLNLSAFQYDYQDLQVNFFLRPGVTDIRNAATANIEGLEAEIALVPMHGVQVGTSVSLLDAEYSSFPNAPLRNNVGSFDASGKHLNDSPATQVNPYVNADFPLSGAWSFFFSSSGSWTSRSYFTPQNTLLESQGPFWLLNGAVGVKREGLSVSLWGRNLTGEDYVTGTASFAFARVAARVGAPRTFGIQLRVDF